MAMEDVLRSHKPVENEDDSGFEILKGTYKTAIMKLKLAVHEEYGERYELELVVNEILDGNGAPGRKLWKRYKADDVGMTKLLDDMFTAGVALPRGSVQEFNEGLGQAIDKDVIVRAWGWTPDKTVNGEPIPEDERSTRQQFKIVSGKKVKPKKTGVSF